jgi:nicotinate-nucleotide adenylyltransferase
MVRLPPHGPGLRIGLYGGTFNPPHAGHWHVSLLALKRLRLDRVWWLVTPGNPLKERVSLPSTADRVAAVRRLAADPRIDVTGFEADIRSSYTVDTLRWLASRCPGPAFVWIMGADSLAGFHRWKGWAEIAGLMPLAVVDRPGWTLRATQSRAAQALAPYRWPEAEAGGIAGADAPAWVMLHGPRSHLSSTALRHGARSAIYAGPH